MLLTYRLYFYSRSIYKFSTNKCTLCKQRIFIKKLYDTLFLKYKCRSMWKLPLDIRDMKILDKEKFNSSQQVPSITFTLKEQDTRIKLLKTVLLKIPKILNPIKTDDKRIYLLDSHYKEILMEQNIWNQFLESFSLDAISPYKLDLTYDNWNYIDIFKAILPIDSNNLSSYSSVGHIIHLNLKDVHLEYKRLIGQVFLDKIKVCRTVLNKKDVISNEYRNFEYELLAGDPDTNAVVRENNCTFHFDYAKVYWNPRLSTEHERIIQKLNCTDVLFDLFAGVGPFAIPAAKVAHCRAVYANDLNPDCVAYLEKNVVKNKIRADMALTIYRMNARDFIGSVLAPFLTRQLKLRYGQLKVLDHEPVPGPADMFEADGSLDDFTGDVHVTMNLPEKAMEFLPYFTNIVSTLNVLGPSDGTGRTTDVDPGTELAPTVPPFSVIVHLYCFVRDRDRPEMAAREMLMGAMNARRPPSLIDYGNDEEDGGESKRLRVAGKRKDGDYGLVFKEDQILETILVRKVSPSKDMVRLTFKMPLEIMGFNLSSHSFEK